MSTVSYWRDGAFHQEINGVLRRLEPAGDGISRSWHANGELKSELSVMDGKVAGAGRKWHDNGVLARETPYRNGLIDGIVRQWSRDGKLLGTYEMKSGQGIRREWHDDGSMKSEFEEVAKGHHRVVIFDNLGNGIECYMRNGRGVSKARFIESVKSLREK